jgi:disulfide bond formation protein DsbB
MDDTMNRYRPVLLAAGLISIAMLVVALYLQHGLNMLPCPLCVLQRYAFAVVAIVCLVAAGLPPGGQRAGAGLGTLAALAGLATAGWHLWIKAHPNVSCGIDPLETSLNTIPTARLLPFLFQADGLCTTEYPPILGLSSPQWSFLWFALFAVLLAFATLRRAK